MDDVAPNSQVTIYNADPAIENIDPALLQHPAQDVAATKIDPAPLQHTAQDPAFDPLIDVSDTTVDGVAPEPQVAVYDSDPAAGNIDPALLQLGDECSIFADRSDDEPGSPWNDRQKALARELGDSDFADHESPSGIMVPGFGNLQNGHLLPSGSDDFLPSVLDSQYTSTQLAGVSSDEYSFVQPGRGPGMTLANDVVDLARTIGYGKSEPPSTSAYPTTARDQDRTSRKRSPDQMCFDSSARDGFTPFYPGATYFDGVPAATGDQGPPSRKRSHHQMCNDNSARDEFTPFQPGTTYSNGIPTTTGNQSGSSLELPGHTEDAYLPNSTRQAPPLAGEGYLSPACDSLGLFTFRPLDLPH